MDTRARRSFPLPMLSYASNQALRLAATIVLARILVPATSASSRSRRLQ